MIVFVSPPHCGAYPSFSSFELLFTLGNLDDRIESCLPQMFSTIKELPWPL